MAARAVGIMGRAEMNALLVLEKLTQRVCFGAWVLGHLKEFHIVPPCRIQRWPQHIVLYFATSKACLDIQKNRPLQRRPHRPGLHELEPRLRHAAVLR